MGEATWTSICNVGTGTGCIFLNGPRQLCDPRPDGIVGTGDGNCVGLPDAMLLLGPDGNFSDAVRVRLSNFTRTITITRIDANLSQIQMICHLFKRMMDGAQLHTDYFAALRGIDSATRRR